MRASNSEIWEQEMLPQAAPLLKRTDASIISSRDTGHRGHSYYGPPSHSHSFRRLPIPGLTTSLWGTCVNSPILPRMTQTLLCTVWTQSSPQWGQWGAILRVWRDRLWAGSSARARKDHACAEESFVRNPERSAGRPLPQRAIPETERNSRPLWKGCDRGVLSAPRLTATASEVTDEAEGVGVLQQPPPQTRLSAGDGWVRPPLRLRSGQEQPEWARALLPPTLRHGTEIM